MRPWFQIRPIFSNYTVSSKYRLCSITRKKQVACFYLRGASVSYKRRVAVQHPATDPNAASWMDSGAGQCAGGRAHSDCASLKPPNFGGPLHFHHGRTAQAAMHPIAYDIGVPEDTGQHGPVYSNHLPRSQPALVLGSPTQLLHPKPVRPGAIDLRGIDFLASQEPEPPSQVGQQLSTQPNTAVLPGVKWRGQPLPEQRGQRKRCLEDDLPALLDPTGQDKRHVKCLKCGVKIALSGWADWEMHMMRCTKRRTLEERKKCLEGDPLALLDPEGDMCRVKCLSCQTTVKLRYEYELAPWEKHRTRCDGPIVSIFRSVSCQNSLLYFSKLNTNQGHAQFLNESRTIQKRSI